MTQPNNQNGRRNRQKVTGLATIAAGPSKGMKLVASTIPSWETHAGTLGGKTIACDKSHVIDPHNIALCNAVGDVAIHGSDDLTMLGINLAKARGCQVLVPDKLKPLVAGQKLSVSSA